MTKKSSGRVRGVLSERPFFDLLVVGLVAGTVLYLAQDRWLGVADAERRSAVAQMMVGLTGGLLGLVAAALAIIKGVGSGRRVVALRREYGGAITRNMMASLRGLGLACGLGVAILIGDTTAEAPLWVQGAAYIGIGLTAARVARAVWVMGLIIRVEDADGREAAAGRQPVPSVPPPLRETKPGPPRPRHKTPSIR